MKPAELLKIVLPRWRAKMSRQFSLATLDGFVRRNRATLEELVARALADRQVTCGALPETPEEFAAYLARAA
ncbi:hypothetical protein [Nannocystis bainbridge]|uniref:Uncharacterized protein n=1 Tax=Nannocystis bainbridge TaxID=2995303 RepID=A0ABT5E9W0_9BACT|nr:hypothetical protein [Nannocystis bainbridge]MDC0721728.1 hypothetical protein [Nannocystis bainbridge]